MQVKKLLTKEEQLKKRKKRNLFIALILIIIMIGGGGGIAINNLTSDSNSADQLKYNGIQFYRDQNSNWQFNYGDKIFVTRFNPLELNDTKVSVGKSLSDYKDKPLYIVNGEDGASFEIAQNLDGIPLRISPGCMSQNCSGNYHIINCESENGIIFKSLSGSGQERAYKEGNCVYLVSGLSNQIKFADAFLYGLLGI